MKTICLALLLVSLAACGHFEMSGTVVHKQNDLNATLCMNPGQVLVGQKVTVYRHDCFIPPTAATCRKVEVSEGEVVQLLNDHYSTARFSNADFKVGDTVEAKR